MPSPLEVKASVLSCRDCSLVEACRCPVAGSFNLQSDIMVIGEAPGAKEDKLGKVFVGPSGDLLRSWIRKIGWDDQFLSYANAVSCFPHRTPRVAEINACRHNLWSQIAVVRPRYLLLVGTVAVQSWWPGIGVESVKGTFWQAYWDNRDKNELGEVGDGWSWAMATYHPAAVLRNVGLAPEVMGHLATFKDVVSGKVHPGEVYNDHCTSCPEPVEVVRWGLGFCYEHEPKGPGRALMNFTRKDGVVPPFTGVGSWVDGKIVRNVEVQGKML